MATPCGLQDLSSPIRDSTYAPAVEVMGPNHWSAREFSVPHFILPWTLFNTSTHSLLLEVLSLLGFVNTSPTLALQHTHKRPALQTLSFHSLAHFSNGHCFLTVFSWKPKLLFMTLVCPLCTTFKTDPEATLCPGLHCLGPHPPPALKHHTSLLQRSTEPSLWVPETASENASGRFQALQDTLQEHSTYWEWKKEPLERLEGPRPSSPFGSPRFTVLQSRWPLVTPWLCGYILTIGPCLATRLPPRPPAPRPSPTCMPILPWFSIFLRCPSPPGTHGHLSLFPPLDEKLHDGRALLLLCL